MSWPTGVETIKKLISAGSLQRVSPSMEAAQGLLDAAAKHLDSARTIARSDPDGAYALVYDAARKSLVALLEAQGLRATSKGGHYAVQEAVAAQFTKPPPSDTFRSFARLRRMRNQDEYDDVARITVADVEADAESARAMQAMASRLIAQLPVFTD